MKHFHYLFLAACGLSFMPLVHADVPGILSYQGRLSQNNGNYAGPVWLKFALVDGVNGTTYWANEDGSSVNGSEPTEYTIVNASGNGGFFSLMLGDTSLQNMDVIPHSVFSHPDVRLRVWVSTGELEFTLLTPDQRIAPAGYAMQAATLPNGAVTSAMLANNAVTGAKLAAGAVTGAHLAAATITGDKLALNTILAGSLVNNSVGTAQLADSITLETLGLGSVNWDGTLNVYASPPGGGIVIDPLGNLRARLSAADATGTLELFGGTGSVAVRAMASANGGAGFMSVFRPGGNFGVNLSGGDTNDPGGEVSLYHPDAGGISRIGLSLDGNSTGSGGRIGLNDITGAERIQLLASAASGEGALFTMRNESNSITVSLDADASGNGSAFSLYSGAGVNSLFFDGDSSGAGLMEVRDTDGTATIRLLGAQSGTTGGRLEMFQANGENTVILDGEVGTGGGGYLQLRKGNGTGTITLDADSSGDGRITTQVLEITGGSDLSENFNIQSRDAQPGMMTCIDPAHPGELIISRRAYDRTVAGVVSSAGGVKPGMVMGQAGTLADGKYPVALTGRVYCMVDADHGAIEPGDLITSSDTPGHGMKVTDHARAQGAIIGKAMTGLSEGQGLVLVLVSLQ